MSFLDHLDELRRRIIYAAISLGVGVVIAFFFIDDIFNFIMRPLQAMLPAGQTLIYTDPTEAFMLYVKIALIAGLMIASPAVMTQVWLFIAPGLYVHEKKWAIPFIAMSTVFFVARRRVLALRGLPADVAVLRQLHHRHPDVHAAHRAGVLDLPAAAAGVRRRLPDADDRAVPGQDGRPHGALHDPQHQVRRFSGS